MTPDGEALGLKAVEATESSEASDDSLGDSLGVIVCRLAIDPSSGRTRHPTHTGIAIRAALFVQLLLDQRLVGTAGPAATGAGDTDDQLADAVHRAVASRRTLPWKRWFGHVRADFTAVNELISHDDDDQRAHIVAQADAVKHLISTSSTRSKFATTASSVDAAVALLAVGAGLHGDRPRPRLALRELDRVLPPKRLLEAAGIECPPETDAIRAVVRTALLAMRGRAGLWFFSG